MLEQDKQLVKRANARQLALLKGGQLPTWLSDVLYIPCEGSTYILEAQCNATSSLDEDFTELSCSAATYIKNAGALLLLGDQSSAYRKSFDHYGHFSQGLGHATTTGRLMEPGVMSWDSVFLSDAQPFDMLASGFRALPPNMYLPGVRGPVVVAPSVCKQLEGGEPVLAFLNFPRTAAGSDCWRQALYEQVAASIVAEYRAGTAP